MFWDEYSQYNMLPYYVYALFIQKKEIPVQDWGLDLIVVQATTETCTWKDVYWKLVVSLETS